MVDIEHGRLTALEKNGFATVESVIHDQGHIAHHRFDAVCERQKVIGHFGGVQGGQAHGLENRVLGSQCGFDLGAKGLGVEKILNTDANAVHLVGIGRANTATCRTDLIVTASTLIRLIHQAVICGNDVCISRNEQSRAVHAAA